ncbi:MAG: peptidase C45 [Candidatus Handelsmanbacteria bacterium]|nr:peptidase C45 [Candidatus Handelsmanbacteria bacterium]
MTAPTRYREITVSGPPFELGCQLGEDAREEVRGFAAIALDRVNKTVPISRAKAMAVASASLPYVEGYAPDMLQELRGVAHSSGVSLEELILLQIRNQLQPEKDAGCTSFALAPHTPAHGSVVGQNWDNDPALDPFTVVLTRQPAGKPALMTITQAGLIAYIGLNSEGLGLCMNTLPAPSRPLGVPHYFTVRGIFEATSLEGAVKAVSRAERAIPANIIIASPQGPADLEVTMDQVHLLRDQSLVTHTNHCLHPDLVPINADFPELIQSGPRKARIDHLLQAAGGPLGIETLKQALRDHQDYPCSICRHPNDHPTNGFWVSVFSVIIEADQGRMHLSRGNPCTQPYEVYSLN